MVKIDETKEPLKLEAVRGLKESFHSLNMSQEWRGSGGGYTVSKETDLRAAKLTLGGVDHQTVLLETLENKA